ncbi:MAG TPA: cation diffusion facilitator family transporter [Cytophagales bacterium]|mgnify:CR=1 FL=1|jgi:cation diffusion facilitator family transporter|nr:cation diffusion facilitator family transporter [Cytophagales bacterium]
MLLNSNKPVPIQRFALVVSIILLSIKVIAYYLTLSNTILTDALESIVNVLAGAFALYSIWLASQPRDRNHPYGHGKIEFLSSGVEGILIIVAGISIIYKSVGDILDPHELHRLDTGIALIAFSGLINGVLGYFLVWKGKRLHSILMEANGRHLLSDALSTAGILAGLLIIRFSQYEWLDNVFALIFGVIIIVTGYRIVRKSVAGIMDEADQKVIDALVELLENARKPTWIDIHNFRVIKYGAMLHVDCHVTVPWYYPVKDGHAIIDEIEKIVNEAFERKVEFFIHADPCTPPSCPVCSVPDCPHRQHEFEAKIKWTTENLPVNRRHAAE